MSKLVVLSPSLSFEPQSLVDMNCYVLKDLYLCEPSRVTIGIFFHSGAHQDRHKECNETDAAI
jgi:hypothetical protein